MIYLEDQIGEDRESLRDLKNKIEILGLLMMLLVGWLRLIIVHNEQ